MIPQILTGGGRANDIQITEKSGYLDKLLHGDTILADPRISHIRDSWYQLGCKSFDSWLYKGEITVIAIWSGTDTKIARVCVHVERVIGVIRQKYTILGGPLPIDFLITDENSDIPLIDKLCLICCALYNMTDSIVPFDWCILSCTLWFYAHTVLICV